MRARPGRLVLLGHPIAHSLSPRFQNAALRSAGIPLVYEARDVAPARLRAPAGTRLGWRAAYQRSWWCGHDRGCPACSAASAAMLSNFAFRLWEYGLSGATGTDDLAATCVMSAVLRDGRLVGFSHYSRLSHELRQVISDYGLFICGVWVDVVTICSGGRLGAT